METKVNLAAVGAFVLVLAAAAVAILLWLAAGGAVKKKYDPYQAVVSESVSGLYVDAPVKYMGVTVGKVQDIRIDAADPKKVRLHFEIERGTRITTDTVAVLKAQGLTGIAHVELSGSTNDAPTLVGLNGQPPIINTKPSLSARLENVVTNAAASFERTTQNLNALLSDENRESVRRILADLATVSGTLAERRATIDAMMASAARAADNTARGTENLRETIDQINRAAKSVDTVATNANEAVGRASRVIGSADAGLTRLSVDTLPEFERVLGEVGTLAASARRLAEQTERNPSGLLLGRRQQVPGPGETLTP